MFEISSALASVGTLIGIAKGALDARDEAKAREALAEIQVKLFEATSAALEVASKAMTLQGELSDAKDEIRTLKALAAERAGQHLVQLRPGAYAYSTTPPDADGRHKPPYYCQPCHDKGIKTVLHHNAGTEYTVESWFCPETTSHRITNRNG